MEYCGAGKPIDDTRIKQYEPLCRYLIQFHFSSFPYPSHLTQDDVLNLCRYEVIGALKKFDPAKAIGSNMRDQKRREWKLKQKALNPEKAMAQAEKNVVYWRIDFFLKRLKYRHGYKTASKKRQVRTVSIQYLGDKSAEIAPLHDTTDDFVEDSMMAAMPRRKKERLELLYRRMLSTMRSGKGKAKELFDSVPKSIQPALSEYIQLRARQAARSNESPFTSLVRLTGHNEFDSTNI